MNLNIISHFIIKHIINCIKYVSEIYYIKDKDNLECSLEMHSDRKYKEKLKV